MTLTASTSPTATAFAQRCHALGLIACQVDARGAPRPLVNDDDLTRWITAPTLTENVRHAAETPPTDDGAPQPVEALPGLWLFAFEDQPAGDPGSESNATTTVVIALGRAFDERHGALTVSCENDRLSAAATAAALADHPRLGRSEIGRLAQSLAWSHHDLNHTDQSRQTIDQFSEQLLQSYEEGLMLFRLSQLLKNVTEPIDALHQICGQMLDIQPFDWVALKLHQDRCPVPELRRFTRVVGQTPFEPEVFDNHLEQLITQPGDDWANILSPGGHPLADETEKEVAAYPITHNQTRIGVFVAGSKPGPDSDIHSAEAQFMEATAHFLSVFLENASRFAAIQSLFTGSLKAMVNALDAKDPYTRGHSERVAMLAKQLATRMGLPDETVEDIWISGLVHDVGKIGVPEAVLRKPGKLTDEEFGYIKQHPKAGYDILKDIPPMTNMLPGVLHHHERYDGHGYPHGLTGADIPVFGRILALADTFDAMSSNRAYRSAMPRQRVLDEIRDCAGSQFDPELVPLFLELDFSEFDAMLQLNRMQDQQPIGH
ncbi:MAG: HD-GYP domain-containing protein [Planctomycetota bacterium]|jgi:HD-GYP domain-containing protein (c-di-GMP phosphodiesterase class II)